MSGCDGRGSSVMSTAKWDHKRGRVSAFMAFSSLLLLVNFYFILMAFAISRLLFFVFPFTLSCLNSTPDENL